ncbi:hypothetical protein EW145_g483 [Phellinidium pouzarii]|uniref:Uncharacterized protein n=1 Tax=Phellinidium pouzarii TaxID=167371 RepID=A0A4S4LI97_9AGAM|nr:hypothetical protein EW145_g483 [Phellinidium pouzarii]
MAALPPALSSPHSHRHRKRASLSRLSSDTSSSLPPYRSYLPTIEPFEQPPDYPDSADEADEETDDQSIILSPPFSPVRRRLYRSTSHPRASNLYVNPASQSDTYLDKILERSVAALELSNALLQSSANTKSALSTVLTADSSMSDQMLDTHARGITDRIRDHSGVHDRWMDDLDELARDIEELYDDEPGPSVGRLAVPIRRAHARAVQPDDCPISRSLPSSGLHRKQRRPSLDLQEGRKSVSEAGRLRLSPRERHHFQAPPPRALTQYVSVGAGFREAPQSTLDASSVVLPSTIGLRPSAHVSDFNLASSSSAFSPPPPSPGPSAYASLVRHANRSPSSSRSSCASRSSSITPTYRQRSSSRSSNQTASPHLLPRLIPPPIEELPSQSDSSASDSPHPFRTVETLQKILDKQPMQSNSLDLKDKGAENISPTRAAPSFSPRSPPVGPVAGTSTTTTSISRLFTKGSHSTSTRAPSPPRHSSLKQRSPVPSMMQPRTSSSTLSISDLLTLRSANASGTSSGHSSPHRVVFGPLPESYAGSRPDGTPSKFKEQKEAKARSKSRSRDSGGGKRGRDRDGTGQKEKDGESSWWTTWLIGGSTLSMSASRQEERAENRMARSWGRPAMGAAFEDWTV